MPKQPINLDEHIEKYCALFGITRQQYDAEGTLVQETIDALVELHKSPDADPVIPLGLPGGGVKRRSELSPKEIELLVGNECELQDMLDKPAN